MLEQWSASFRRTVGAAVRRQRPDRDERVFQYPSVSFHASIFATTRQSRPQMTSPIEKFELSRKAMLSKPLNPMAAKSLFKGPDSQPKLQ